MYAQSRVGLILLASACSTTVSRNESSQPTQGTPVEPEPHQSEASKVHPTMPQTVRFSDGSGNRYTVTRAEDGSAQLVYEPVTPKESSSGTYSGGAPADVMLSLEKSSELWERVFALQNNSSSHIGARSMGTGAFVMSGPEGEARFLVRMGEELREFDRFMTELRSPDHR